MKRLSASHWVIVCLAGILIYQQFFMGNTYKKQYEHMLKEKEESFKFEIDRLNHTNDSILTLNQKLVEDIGSIDDKIEEKNQQLAKLRRRYAEQVNKLGDMSDDELATTFADAFK